MDVEYYADCVGVKCTLDISPIYLIDTLNGITLDNSNKGSNSKRRWRRWQHRRRQPRWRWCFFFENVAPTQKSYDAIYTQEPRAEEWKKVIDESKKKGENWLMKWYSCNGKKVWCVTKTGCKSGKKLRRFISSSFSFADLQIPFIDSGWCVCLYCARSPARSLDSKTQFSFWAASIC